MLGPRLYDAGQSLVSSNRVVDHPLLDDICSNSCWCLAVLRTFLLSTDGSVVDELNLVNPTKTHLNNSSNDVLWLPRQPTHIATGAKTGMVLLWDLEKSGSKLSRNISAHQRAINRICCNKADGRMLTASQVRTSAC
eukprot:6197572-Pleurochrysis_carterae.AAC.1